jgi:hypothetical protein
VYIHMSGGKPVGLRSSLYKAARLMGDVNAVKKGKVGKRVARRAAGKATGRSLGKLFK